MNALLDFEPRVAGASVAEPAVDFAISFAATDRTKCPGCCINHTQIDIATKSRTQ